MKLVIFDLDGTILDTLEDLYQATNYMLRKSHLPDRTREEVRSFVGNGIYHLVELALPPICQKDFIDLAFEDFNDYYKDHCNIETKPYNGIIEVMKQLKKEGYLLAVVSNKSDYAVQSLCESYFPGIFDYVAGMRENVRKKPYPDSIYEVCSHLGIEIKDSLYIGDSEVDIETARNANIELITVSYGFRDEAFLKEKGAKTIVSTPNELLSYIK